MVPGRRELGARDLGLVVPPDTASPGKLGEPVCTNTAKWVTSLLSPALDREGTNALGSGSNGQEGRLGLLLSQRCLHVHHQVLSTSSLNAPQAPPLHRTTTANWSPLSAPLAHCHGLLLASLPLASLTPHTYLPEPSSQSTKLTMPLPFLVPPHPWVEAQARYPSYAVSSHIPTSSRMSENSKQVADV